MCVRFSNVTFFACPQMIILMNLNINKSVVVSRNYEWFHPVITVCFQSDFFYIIDF